MYGLSFSISLYCANSSQSLVKMMQWCWRMTKLDLFQLVNFHKSILKEHYRKIKSMITRVRRLNSGSICKIMRFSKQKPCSKTKSQKAHKDYHCSKIFFSSKNHQLDRYKTIRSLWECSLLELMNSKSLYRACGGNGNLSSDKLFSLSLHVKVFLSR